MYGPQQAANAMPPQGQADGLGAVGMVKTGWQNRTLSAISAAVVPAPPVKTTPHERGDAGDEFDWCDSLPKPVFDDAQHSESFRDSLAGDSLISSLTCTHRGIAWAMLSTA
jgi:hypothetical protein